MRVYFIAHGGSELGMGHIMRCIALADGFCSRGHSVCFFSKYIQGAEYISKSGYKVIQQNKRPEIHDGFFYGNADELYEEKMLIETTLNGKKADVIVLDSYNVTKEYMEALRTMTHCLVYIDDLAKFSYPVDIIINGTASAWGLDYARQDKAKLLLLGLNYNILRREFCINRKRDQNNDVRNILITTGGADPYHITERILNFLCDKSWFSEMQFHVIIGRGFSDEIYKNENILKFKNIRLYQTPQFISTVMRQCDLAITAGGSTIYELAACGIPMVVFCYAENQLEQVSQLEKEGLVVDIGFYTQLKERVLEKSIEQLIYDPVLRNKKVVAFGKLIDGGGVDRIIKNIKKFLSEKEK